MTLQMKIDQAKEETSAKYIVSTVESCSSFFHCSIDEACKALGIRQEQYESDKALLIELDEYPVRFD